MASRLGLLALVLLGMVAAGCSGGAPEGDAKTQIDTTAKPSGPPPGVSVGGGGGGAPAGGAAKAEPM